MYSFLCVFHIRYNFHSETAPTVFLFNNHSMMSLPVTSPLRPLTFPGLAPPLKAGYVLYRNHSRCFKFPITTLCNLWRKRFLLGAAIAAKRCDMLRSLLLFATFCRNFQQWSCRKTIQLGCIIYVQQTNNMLTVERFF